MIDWANLGWWGGMMVVALVVLYAAVDFVDHWRRWRRLYK